MKSTLAEPAAEPAARPGRRHRRLPFRIQSSRWLTAFSIGALLLLVSPLGGLAGVGDRWMRLAYGTVATALMLAAVLWAVRRRLPARGPATARSWVQLHVYGGTLFLLAVGFHADWRWPAGALDRWLLAASVLVVGTGLLGVVLRRVVPVLLTRGVKHEVLYERIPEHAADLRERSEAALAGAPEVVEQFYRSSLAREMEVLRPRWRYFVDVAGTTDRVHARLDKLERLCDADGRAVVRKLRALLRAKRELDVHLTLQRPLRWWLVVHVPLSWLLVALVALHLWTVATY